MKGDCELKMSVRYVHLTKESTYYVPEEGSPYYGQTLPRSSPARENGSTSFKSFVKSSSDQNPLHVLWWYVIMVGLIVLFLYLLLTNKERLALNLTFTGVGVALGYMCGLFERILRSD